MSSIDGKLIISDINIQERWKQHFDTVINKVFNESNTLIIHEPQEELAYEIYSEEIARTISQINNS